MEPGNRWEQAAQELRRAIIGSLKFDEPLSRHTTWRIGGPADLFLIPGSLGDVYRAVVISEKFELPVKVIGHGSNLLVRDGGVRGLVVKTYGQISRFWFNNERLYAQAGALLPVLVRQAARRGLGGLEFAVGIPASVGGALATNAGTPDGDLSDIVRRVWVWSKPGGIKVNQPMDLKFGYRYSSLREGGQVILGVELQLHRVQRARIAAAIDEKWQRRKLTQPRGLPSAGSVFVNPPGAAAGYLIEAIGAKGQRRGGAKVSDKHANFIVNEGGATAADVLALIDEVREKVLGKFGVGLETEVEVIGEAP